jgi:hypothetical protein
MRSGIVPKLLQLIRFNTGRNTEAGLQRATRIFRPPMAGEDTAFWRQKQQIKAFCNSIALYPQTGSGALNRIALFTYWIS